MNNLLIVEDDTHIQEILLYILQKEDYSVSDVNNAGAALAYCLEEKSI